MKRSISSVTFASLLAALREREHECRMAGRRLYHTGDEGGALFFFTVADELTCLQIEMALEIPDHGAIQVRYSLSLELLASPTIPQEPSPSSSSSSSSGSYFDPIDGKRI